MDDLFFDAPIPDPHPQPKVGRDHPETSKEAAEKIKPALPNIRARALDALMRAGEAGLTDDELALALPDILINSLRPARVGLTDELWVLDSGSRRENVQGNDCIVWVHRDFHPSAPAIRDRDKPDAKAARDAIRAEALELVPVLESGARQMHSEGRAMFSKELARAARCMAALASTH